VDYKVRSRQYPLWPA